MNTTNLATFVADAEALPEPVKWAANLPVRIPELLAQAIKDAHASIDDAVHSYAMRAADDLRMRAAFTPNSPLSSRLPAHYHSVPGPLRRALAHIIGRLQRMRQASWARFPGWPIDLSADFASDLAGLPSITFKRTPVLLSHDIDTPEGLNNLVRIFLPLEEAVGACSANYIVPCAWPLDDALVSEVKTRGHEVGVHGYDHGNRTPFCEDSERDPAF